MSAPLSGARQARPSWLGQLISRASARELAAFVVPGPEIARAHGLALETAGLRTSPTPRHASVLVVVGELPKGLRRAATVAYAQMPRPRAVLAAGAGDVPPLPEPDVSVGLTQEALGSGVGELRNLLAEGAFDPRAEDFGTDALWSRTEYTCSMHPKVVRDEPGACPKCGMELLPRAASEEDDAHEGHGHEERGHAHHGAEGEHDEAAHGDDDNGETEHDGHDNEDHGADGQEDGEAESGSEEHGGHEGMDHGDHGDMDFMSMVEMTRGMPRSSDGLQMEWVEAPFGPLFPGLPGGLALTFTLDGDTVAEATAGPAMGDRVEDLSGPVSTLVDRFTQLDPLSPFSYRLLALRALETAAGAKVDEETSLARVGALERERAASHLNWLAGFGHLLGYPWLARRAEELHLALLRADAGGIPGIRTQLRKLARTVERTPLLRRRLAGIAGLRGLSEGVGPVARAGGRETDARADEEAYLSLGLEPIILEEGDALSRLLVRLSEAEQSLGFVEEIGEKVSAPEPHAGVSGRGAATVETPRGIATLSVMLEDGGVTDAELETPSEKHLGLVGAVTEQQEVADALVGVGSLDLSPWSVAG